MEPRNARLISLGSVLFFFLSFVPSIAGAPHVSVTSGRLLVEGKQAPYLFGAEIQYFRMRGGPGRNVPAADVERLWNLAIDRVLEAGMNTVTFYIPWDFHEPTEGVFDFDGKLDQDGDGKPDYPSRNLRRFLQLLNERGIRHVMIRPGPYINAEWGPEGFGAIPRWFLDRYPGSLTVTRTKGKPRTVAFADAVYRDRAKRWLSTLYRRVLKDFMGSGSSIQFVQIDNETNYFWDSVYERDLSVPASERYREFLKRQYDGDIKNLNTSYRSAFRYFAEVTPPENASDTSKAAGQWHYDWYLFHDAEIHDYYEFLHGVWEDLGATRDALFTSCDSFNAPEHGLLPRLDLRQGGNLSLTTMNIYPKTFGTQAESTMNTPMKAAHDAKLVASAHESFYGNASNWVMSTETVGGWFAPTEVSLATRQHTYGSLVASGVKALIVYYFHEGWNWDGLEKNDTPLFFDAPLDKDLKPRPAFGLLRDFGKSLHDGLGADAVESEPVLAPVLIAHASAYQYPVPGAPDALKAASTSSASLFGLFREVGAMPEVGFLEGKTLPMLKRYRMIVWQHTGYLAGKVRDQLESYVDAGGTLVMIGGADISVRGRGRVIRLATSPAEGWDSDAYTRLPKVKDSLKWAVDTLAVAGVPALVDIQAEDGRPFVHAWLRKVTGAGKVLLAVENFDRAARTVKVRIPARELPFAQTYQLVSRLSASGKGGAVVVTAGKLTGEGVKLEVSPDGIDIWAVEPAP